MQDLKSPRGHATLLLVDLAGSERQTGSDQAANKEGTNINSSLLTLKKVCAEGWSVWLWAAVVGVVAGKTKASRTSWKQVQPDADAHQGVQERI